MILRQKLGRGEVTEEWFVDRTRTLAETYPEDGTDQRLHLTSDFTLLGPLRFHLYRQVRLRAAALGRTLDVDERRIAEGVRRNGRRNETTKTARAQSSWPRLK